MKPVAGFVGVEAKSATERRRQLLEASLDAGTRQELAALGRELQEAHDLLRTSTVSYVRGRLEAIVVKLEELLERSDPADPAR